MSHEASIVIHRDVTTGEEFDTALPLVARLCAMSSVAPPMSLAEKNLSPGTLRRAERHTRLHSARLCQPPRNFGDRIEKLWQCISPTVILSVDPREKGSWTRDAVSGGKRIRNPEGLRRDSTRNRIMEVRGSESHRFDLRSRMWKRVREICGFTHEDSPHWKFSPSESDVFDSDIRTNVRLNQAYQCCIHHKSRSLYL